MLNRVILVGRMVRDPELRRTCNGTPVTSFTLAMNRKVTSQNGEKQADFVPCVVWNKTAESTAQYCSKGSLVGIDGRLQSRSYQDNNGNNRNIIEVICESVQFLDTKNSNQEQATNNKTSDKYGYASGYENEFNQMMAQDIQKDFDNSMNTFDIMDDDIQF